MENKENSKHDLQKRHPVWDWIMGHIGIRKLGAFISRFSYIWLLLFILVILMFFSSQNNWSTVLSITRILLVLVTMLILLRPMNAVYGLMGTNGSIRLFFFLFLFISILFSGVYYWGFFNKAAISYDVNQAHIDYSLYSVIDKPAVNQSTVVQILPKQRDTIEYIKIINGERVVEKIVKMTNEELNYQQISPWMVWRNTIMTTLMQEPTDFFAIATTFNAQMEGSKRIIVRNGDKDVYESCPNTSNGGMFSVNEQKASLFHWILIFQVLISWIFFGVFISLLYNKFRYES